VLLPETDFLSITNRCALRETLEITGLSVKDLKVEDGFRAEIKYLSGTKYGLEQCMLTHKDWMAIFSQLGCH